VWEEARGCLTPQRCGAWLDPLRVWGGEGLFCFFDVAGGVEVEEDSDAHQGGKVCMPVVLFFADAAAAQFSMEHTSLLLLHQGHRL